MKVATMRSDVGDEVGWTEMDRQHRSLAELFRSLAEGAHDRDSDLAILATIEIQLHEHFAWEESQMRIAGYPDISSHRSDHRRQEMNLRDLEKLVREGGEALDQAFFHACQEWLGRHVRTMDREFAQYRDERELWELRRQLRDWEYSERLESVPD
jgi:hemerythrin-like metal-binding protein